MQKHSSKTRTSFARYYTDENPDRPPSNHVIIFDEAQTRLGSRPEPQPNSSSPTPSQRCCSRSWSVIKTGPSSSPWSAAARRSTAAKPASASGVVLYPPPPKSWTVYASPEGLEGGSSVAGSRLEFHSEVRTLSIHSEPQLHTLDISVRNLRADQFASWVNDVVNGDAASAASRKAQESFPILLTRSLADLRELLAQNTLGQSRCGLVASSGAARLRAEGLEPDSTFHGEYPWDHW